MTVKELLFIWYAGLIRGAIAFGLVLRVDDFFPNRELIVTTVLSLVVFTTIFCGSTVGLLSSCLFKEDGENDEDDQSEHSVMDHPNFIKDDKFVSSEDTANWWQNLEANYLQPWFVYRHSTQQRNIMDKMHEAIVDEGDEMEKEFANSKPEESKHVEQTINQLLVP